MSKLFSMNAYDVKIICPSCHEKHPINPYNNTSSKWNLISWQGYTRSLRVTCSHCGIGLKVEQKLWTTILAYVLLEVLLCIPIFLIEALPLRSITVNLWLLACLTSVVAAFCWLFRDPSFWLYVSIVSHTIHTHKVPDWKSSSEKNLFIGLSRLKSAPRILSDPDGFCVLY